MSKLESRKPLERLSMQTRNYTVAHYLADEDRRREKFDLSPAYQRESVWTLEQRQALIKSMYLGVPFGAVTINERGYDSATNIRLYGTELYLGVIDGKQRIETIRAFAASEFSIPAWWLGDRDKDARFSDEITFADMSGPGRRRFENTGFPMQLTTVIGLDAEADVFLLLNGGGTAQDEASMERAAKVAGA